MRNSRQAALRLFPLRHVHSIPVLYALDVKLNTSSCVQVGNVDMLNCYYAHADRSDGLQVSPLLPVIVGTHCGALHALLHDRLCRIFSSHFAFPSAEALLLAAGK